MLFMNRRWIRLGMLIMSIAMIMSPYGNSAEILKEIPGLVWEHEYGEENVCYEVKAVGLNTNHEIMVTGVSQKVGGMLSDQRGWLWKITQEGKKVTETEIKSPALEKKDVHVYDINDLTVLDNGDTLLFVKFGSPRLRAIVRINKEGKQITTNTLKGLQSDSRSFAKMLPLADGKYLLMGAEILGGSKPSNLFVVKIDGTGVITWERKQEEIVPEKHYAMLMGGMATEDGGFILVGERGALKMLSGKPNEVFVNLYDTNGELKQQKVFQGRMGSIARLSGGGYAMVYDQNLALGQDIRVVAMDSQLKPLWHLPITSGEWYGGPFAIASPSDGEIILVGTKDARLYGVRMNRKGEQIWTFQREMLARQGGGFRRPIVWRGDEFIVASTLSALMVDPSGKKHPCDKVGLIKFMVK